MAPKPGSYVMQHQRSPLQTVHEQASTKDEQSVLVKNECILFSQSIMSGKWNPAAAQTAKPAASVAIEGPEPRVLSKKRRDLINAEIRELQNLLPLKKSARERLSYLGILALTNTFIRKATFFKKECISCDSSMSCALVSEFSSSLCGFLLVFNRDGKILFSSENILDYLGNTVVELASQGDSIYDFVDKEDHDQVRTQLDAPPHDDRGEARRLTFFCRMSTSRYMKTQMRSWKNKIVHVTGRYHRPEMTNDWTDTVFFAVCTPVESKPVTDVRHHPSPRAREFKALHGPDMKFLEVPNTVESLLGYKPEELENTSWYHWIYPDDVEQAKQQHLKFVKEDGSALACVLRVIKKDGSTAWVDITAEKSQESVASSFICNYIVIDEEEVPYFRIHHNLLPFPDHYTEAQRQYLSYRSTLLNAALNNDTNSTSTSPMTSPTAIGHTDSSRIAMAQQVFGELDTKSILRRQLIKRKMSAVETTPIATAPYASDVFGMQPNKMLIRSTSEMPYQAAGVYHMPLQHSTSFPDASYHTHMLYRGFSTSEESYLAQLHSPTTSTDYLFEGGYTTLAPVRPHTLTFRPSQRSPVQSSESNSPVNGHSAQRNQNNNTQMSSIQYSNQYFAPYPNMPAQTAKSPANESAFYHPAVSPNVQTSSQSSPAQVTPAPRLSRRVSSLRRSVDGLFRDVNEIIDEEMVEDTASTPSSGLVTSEAHSTSPQESGRSSPIDKQSSQFNIPSISLTSKVSDRLPPLYVSWSQPVSSASDLQPTNLSMHSVKQEAAESSLVTTGSASLPKVTVSLASSQIQKTSSTPAKSTPQTYASTQTSQTRNEVQDYRIRSSDKPYLVQYSIASEHPVTMQQYQAAAAAFYRATQQDPTSRETEEGLELVKKFGNMSNMEMLFSESMVPGSASLE